MLGTVGEWSSVESFLCADGSKSADVVMKSLNSKTRSVEPYVLHKSVLHSLAVNSVNVSHSQLRVFCDALVQCPDVNGCPCSGLS